MKIGIIKKSINQLAMTQDTQKRMEIANKINENIDKLSADLDNCYSGLRDARAIIDKELCALFELYSEDARMVDAGDNLG